MCVFLGFFMLLPTLSLYLVAVGCDEKVIGLIFATFAVSSVLSRFGANRISQKYGYLAIIRCGLVFCALGSFLYFLIQRPLSYAFARLLFGAGYGLTSTLVVTIAVSVIPPTRLAEGLGYLGLGATVALAIGPIAGLWLFATMGHTALFCGVAGCYVLAVLVSLRLPKTKAAPPKTGSSWSIATTIKTLYQPSLLIFLYGMAVAAVSAYLAVYCVEKNLPNAANYFLVSTIGALFSRLTSGRIYDRYGSRAVVVPAAAIVGLALILIYLAQSVFSYYLAAVLYGLGVGPLFPGLQALAFSSAPRDKMTTASAFFYTFNDIGVSVGTMIMGFLANSQGSFGTSYLLGAGLMALIIVFFLAFFPRKRANRQSL
jgi:MFS family permease